MSIRRFNNIKRSGVTFEPSANLLALNNATATGPNYAIWATSGDMGALSSGVGAANLKRVDHGLRTITPSSVPPKLTNNPITYWIVGGGGAGSSGNTAGAGGGGGGYSSGSFSIGSSPIPIVVGYGGTGTNPSIRDNPGIPGMGQGGTTTIGTNSVIGGGRGAMGGGSFGNGPGGPEGDASPGASGGGGARFHPTQGSGSPQGNPGGDGGGGCPSYGSGGGGGASTPGESFACYPISIAGRGGDGIQCPTTFRPFGYGAPGPGSPTGYFCGGGGGSNWNQSTTQHGGFGGGGGNQNPNTTIDPSYPVMNANPNSGGGGGGVGSGTNPLGEVFVGGFPIPASRGGNGGAGIIMIVY